MRESKPHILIDHKGFTLVEIVIATLLFSVAMLGIASLATVVMRGNFISKQISTSTALSRQKIEDYINRGYGYGIYSTGTVTEDYGSITSADNATSLYSGYRRVSVIQNGPAANLRTVTVTVSSKSGSATSRFSTIIAK